MVQRENPAVGLARTLGDQLTSQAQLLSAYDRYYKGLHPPGYHHEKVGEEYAKLLAQAISNFPELIIDTIGDKLEVVGFRLGNDGQDPRNALAWEAWQDDNMDLFAPMIHTQSLVGGCGYSLVWDHGNGPKMSGESAYEVTHQSEPGDPLNVKRALKRWADPIAEKWHALVFDGDTVTRLEGDWKEGQPAPDKWGVVETLDNPFDDVVPITPYLNKPQLNGTGRAELDSVISIIDRINTLTTQLLLAGELTAFRIRWATGIDVPVDPATGNRVEPYNVAMDRLWVSENESAKFGSFDATDLRPYAEALDQAIQQLAAITRTPPFLLLGKLTNLSAEALKATESGNVKKVRLRARSLGQSHERAMRLRLGITDDIEILWVDPENVSEAARVDALAKLYNIGLPWEAIMERYSGDPKEIARWRDQRDEDALQRVLLEGAQSQASLGVVGQPGQNEELPTNPQEGEEAR